MRSGRAVRAWALKAMIRRPEGTFPRTGFPIMVKCEGHSSVPYHRRPRHRLHVTLVSCGGREGESEAESSGGRAAVDGEPDHRHDGTVPG